MAADTTTVVVHDSSPPLVDLLYATDAIVAVSSRVDNPQLLPDHLVDHRADTAWNGRTGELVGAWVAFRVPADAYVDHVMINAGFDKILGHEDLFAANYRITKLRVVRDGAQLREVTLDPADCRPQRVEIGQAGGDFKLEVAAVVPGSHAGWREIAVSELAVLGTLGASRRATPGPPIVRVGGLDANALAPDVYSPTYAAACKAFVDAANVDGSGAATATCDGPTSRLPGRGNILEIARVSTSDVPRGMYETHFEGDVLAVRTAAGVKLTNVRLAGKEDAWFWSVTYKLLLETWKDNELVVDVEEHRVTDSDGYVEPGHEAEAHSEETIVMRTTCEADTATCSTTAR